MTEIILSFFAVIGITLLTMQFCDFIFYRKFKSRLPLIVNIREKEEKDVIEIFELITSVRQRTSGKAVISELIILVDSKSDRKSDIANKYIETFRLNGTLYEKGEDTWKETY